MSIRVASAPGDTHSIGTGHGKVVGAERADQCWRRGDRDGCAERSNILSAGPTDRIGPGDQKCSCRAECCLGLAGVRRHRHASAWSLYGETRTGIQGNQVTEQVVIIPIPINLHKTSANWLVIYPGVEERLGSHGVRRNLSKEELRPIVVSGAVVV